MTNRPNIEPFDIEPYTNKIAQFRFAGSQLDFALSQALFSSFDIDAGSRLLLKSVAKRIDPGSLNRIIDVGSGVGILGIAVSRWAERAETLLRDRDALAVSFSRANAQRNNAEACRAEGVLGFEPRTPAGGGGEFDLALSNLPAKAGQPVLETFCGGALRILSSDGVAAFVVVNTLTGFLAGAIERAGGSVVFIEEGREHTVFHVARDHGSDPAELSPGARVDDSGPAVIDPAYIRRRDAFSLAGREYELTTAYGLPEFDTPSYATGLVAKILADLRAAGDMLVWEPGQGHIPVWYCSAGGGDVITLTGRDLLALEISRLNVRANRCVDVAIHHIPGLPALSAALTGRRYAILVANPEPIRGVPWDDYLVTAAHDLLDTGGFLVVAGRSSDLHRFDRSREGFSVAASRKTRGFRCVALRRRPDTRE